jgi:intracellular sulfur oxidation DsrE/DsrF family protein
MSIIQQARQWARHIVAAYALGTVVVGALPAAAQTATLPDRVVYHIDNSAAQATKGLRNIRNHLDVAPDTQIVVVTHADGVDFLMEGAKDEKNPNVDYGSLVSALKARKVRFEVCEITLKNRNLKREQFSLDAEFTPSGVVRIGRLQAREGFAYIKP